MNHVPGADAPLRILQVNSLFSGGGVDNQTLELSRGLRELGHDVTLAVAAGSRWENRAREIGCLVETFPSKSALRWRLILCVAGLIRRQRPHLLHLHQGRDYWPGIIAAKLALRGTRVVITRHLISRPRGVSRHMLLRTAQIVAVSRAVERVLRAELRGPAARIHQVYCGIDVSRFQRTRTEASEALRAELGWRPEQVVFGVVGMFEPPRGKGQFEFLEAAARVAKEFPQARFALVGQGGLRAELKASVARLGLTDRLRFLGFRDEMPPVMGALDVLVHPNTGTEAFPLVVLEAFASGKPVIASDIDGIPEQVVPGENGFLVPRADVPALAAAMTKLAGDAPLRSRLGRNGRSLVEAKFTRARLAENFVALYRQVLAGGSA